MINCESTAVEKGLEHAQFRNFHQGGRYLKSPNITCYIRWRLCASNRALRRALWNFRNKIPCRRVQSSVGFAKNPAVQCGYLDISFMRGIVFNLRHTWEQPDSKQSIDRWDGIHNATIGRLFDGHPFRKSLRCSALQCSVNILQCSAVQFDEMCTAQGSI